MNPDRMVIRLAAISALNNYNTAPYPTLAGPNVFDSKIVPVEDFKEDVIFPVCVVYTDYDREHWNHHTVNNVRDRTLTVTFELLMAQVTPSAEDGVYLVTHPVTDSELETSLDVFEMQIVSALQADNVAADCWRHLVMSYVNVISRRGATVEGGSKLAARQVTVEAKIPRGPTNGAIAPPVAAFLNRLEQAEDFQARVPAIRSLYTKASTLTASDQLLAAMGWSTNAGGLLGYHRGPQPHLPSGVIYTLPNGNPLP